MASLSSSVKNDLNVNDVTPVLKTKETEPRKKIVLGRGYSLMDWIRFTKETPDLAGNQGVLRKITYDELAKHNKEDDCWLAIYDKVYNVTPYMKFHPGGIEELMKGAGINATTLFNDVHPWVNLQSMLEKCLVGNLVGPPPVNTQKKIEKTPLSTPKIEKKEISDDHKFTEDSIITVVDVDDVEGIDYKLIKMNKGKKKSIEIPVFDSYQSNECVNIVIYTKCKNLRSESVVIDKNLNNTTLYVYTTNGIYKYTLDLPAPVKSDYNIKLNNEGKIELILYKIEKIHWWQMCPKLNFNAEIIHNNSSGINYRTCELVDRKNLTHDTDLYIFNLPVSSRMCIPIGYHVYLRLVDDNLICKPYTVINSTLSSQTQAEIDGKQICLIIKHYEEGTLTPSLKQLKIGSHIEISNYVGTFQLEKLNNCNELILICAGTGLTPMLKLLSYSINIQSIIMVKMLFYNKTIKDIIWKNELESFAQLHSNKINIINILTRAEPEWEGRTGVINSETLNEMIEPSNLIKPYFCICGPKGFTDKTIDLIKNLGYNDENIHAFLS